MPRLPDTSQSAIAKRAALTKKSQEEAKAKGPPPPVVPKIRIAKGR